MYVATSKQMKNYDAKLISEGYAIETLVDKASDCLVPYCNPYNKIAIISGPGNNGADGISLAIKLSELNKEVVLYLVGDFTKASYATTFYLNIAKEKKLPTFVVTKEKMLEREKELSNVELIVDAIFGFGLHSNPDGIIALLITCINKIEKVPVVAVDIPTGLQCDTGIPYSNVIYANQTVTLTAWKYGFLNPLSKSYTGEVSVECLATKDFHKELGIAKLVDQNWVVSQVWRRSYDSHKGTYGKVLHVTGSDAYKGAALLSAKASVYSGSGMVSVYSTAEVLSNLNSSIPEATSMLREETLDYESINRYDALLVGCGLGLTKESESYIKGLLLNAMIPLVIDADALTIVAKHKELLKQYAYPIILTPHIGEFERLRPYFNESDAVDEAKSFAKEHGVILVLKGPNSIITDGDVVYRNTTGNPAMATAGMGDVLAGIMVSFVGQGYLATVAAVVATFIHGWCGDNLALEYYTAIPSKVIEEIPKVMKEIIDLK